MSKTADTIVLSVAGRDVAISNPQKVLFPEAGITKLDLAHYYLSVADGALRGAGGRPNVLVRYPNGVGGEFFFQKRAPAARPASGSKWWNCPFPRDVGRRKWFRGTSRRCCGWRTSPVSSCIRTRYGPTTWIIRMSCASISTGTRRRMVAGADRCAGGPRRARRRRSGRVAQDFWLARHARDRAGGAALDVRPDSTGGVSHGARRRTSRAAARDQ